jgi:PAS domain S-box-containing protein
MSIEPAGGIQSSATAVSAATAGDAAATDAASATAELAEIQRLAHVGSWHADLRTGARRWSAELLRIYGLPADALPPTREEQRAMMDPVEFTEMVVRLDKAATSGETGDIEYWVTRSDGTTRRVNGRVEAVRDAAGAITGVRGTGADVTELLATRTALARSESRYRLLAENASDVVMSMKPDGTIDWVSPSVSDILGWRPRDLVGRQALDLAHPDDHPVVFATRDSALTGKPGRFEVRVLAEDGSWHWVSLNARMLRNPDGSIAGRISAWRMIDDAVAARQALAASEARYRLLAENAGDVVASIDNSGVIDWISPSVTEVFGWLPEELVGTPAIALSHPESRRAVVAARRPSLAGELTRFAGQIRTRSGAYRWVDVSTRPIADAAGKITGRVSTWRDIETEVAAREEVLEGKRLLEAVFESTSDAVFAKDADGRYIVCNRVTAALVGKTAAEMIGLTDADLFPVDNATAIRKDDLRVMVAGEPETVDEEIVFADGRTHWTMATKAPLRDTAGAVMGIVGVIRDVTERREAEARYRSTLDRMLEGCMLIDRNWRYVYLNDVAAAHGQTTRAAALGKTMAEAQPGIERTEAFARFRLCMDTREHQRFEASYSFEDGVTNWFSFSVEPVPEGIFVLSVDITEQRQTTEALRDSEARLAEALRLEAIGRLAGGVAHDFNNLLMAINGTAELLAAETPADDPRRADVDAISEAGRRAAALTSQLLAFGRRQVLRPTVVSLDEVLAESTPLLRRTLGEDIELRVEAAKDATPVRVDRSQLEQVIVNLAFNARDAMPDGGVLTLAITPTIADEVVASHHDGVHPGRFIRLSVSDTGIGIATDIADRIFEPFFTTKGLGRGTGLGLATVQGIVAQSGGWIEVDSELGHGSTFHVHLPVAAEPVVSAVEPPAITVLGGSELILLVEDEEQVRHVAVRMLRELGYAVMELAGPYPALAMDTGALATVDLLVTDVVMPGLNGLRLDSLLRERSPRLRTIFMSGFAPDAAVRERLEIPGTTFLEKPFTRADLARSVRTILDTPLASNAADAADAADPSGARDGVTPG